MAISAIGQIGGRGAVRALERLAEDAGEADLELIQAAIDDVEYPARAAPTCPLRDPRRRPAGSTTPALAGDPVGVGRGRSVLRGPSPSIVAMGQLQAAVWLGCRADSGPELRRGGARPGAVPDEGRHEHRLHSARTGLAPLGTPKRSSELWTRVDEVARQRKTLTIIVEPDRPLPEPKAPRCAADTRPRADSAGPDGQGRTRRRPVADRPDAFENAIQRAPGEKAEGSQRASRRSRTTRLVSSTRCC